MTRTTIIFLLCFLWMSALPALADAQDDKAIFHRYMQSMLAEKHQPTGELMIKTAQFFLGRPYVANTLEKEPEGLVINFRQLDCMTLVETALSLVRTLREGTPSFEAYARNLRELRYRQGEIRDYTDRLHYTADWIHENERKGVLKNITGDIGGRPLRINVSYVSDQPDAFRQLKGQTALIEKIIKQENAINARSYCYIPRQEIHAHAAKIQSGDIVCFVTSRKGLDISHMGIAYRADGKLTFIHASTKAKQVVVDKQSLHDYTQGVAKHIGIIVVRPQF